VSKGAENLHDTTNAESSLPLHTNMQADVSQKAGVDVHVNGVGQNQQMYADEGTLHPILANVTLSSY
jgi:hypothetical protein